MTRYPDLVQGTKLDTSFDGDYTLHEHDDSEDEQRLSRPTRRVEYWATERPLAEGGFGEVYLQRCRGGGGRQQVEWRAVKVVSKHKSRVKKINYVTELEAIAKFSQKRYSKCFVKLLGWYDTDDHLFIAMEYFPLGDLQCYMSESQPLPEPDAQHISYQVLEGLNYMHSEDFAHRDIKPANILIKSRPPDGWWIKLSDFGISKRFDPSAVQISTIKGTISYMAPELFGQEAGVPVVINHQAADVWSVGETVFRMLSKAAAFPSLHALSRYLARPDLFPSKPLEQVGVSQQTLDFIQSLMRPAPEARLTSSQALDHAWLRPLRPYAPAILPIASQSGSTTPVPPMAPELPGGVGQWATTTSTGMSVSREILSTSAPSRSTTGHLTARAIKSRQGLDPPPALRPPTSLLSKDKAPAIESRSNAPLVPPHPESEPPITLRPNDKVWDRDAFSCMQTLKGHGGSVTSVVFSPDGRKVISGSYDSTVKVWDRNSGKCIATLEGHDGVVTPVAVSPDGKRVISGSADSTAKIWDSNSGKCIGTLEGHRSDITCLAVSPDGHQVISGSYDGTIKVWDCHLGISKETLRGNNFYISSVAFSPDSRHFISGSYEGAVKVWSCQPSRYSTALAPQSRSRRVASRYSTTHCVATIRSYNCGFITSVAFAPDGQQFAGAAIIGDTIKVWDLNSGTCLQQLQHYHSDSGHVASVIFSPDGRQIISGRDDGSIKVWDRISGTCIQTLETAEVRALAISPDSRFIASALADNTVKIWDCNSHA